MQRLHVKNHVLVQTAVLYERYKTPSRFVTKRDFVILTHWFVDERGRIWVVAKSVTHPDMPPAAGVCLGRLL
jgi:hypothetical protein